MDLYDEQRLREEVLYLHSLWHQGPPRQQQSRSNPPIHELSNPPQFKKEKPKSKKKRGQAFQERARKEKFRQENASVSGNEWPVPPTSNASPAATSGWPTASLVDTSDTLLPSPEAKAQYEANQFQSKALNATKLFLLSSKSDDDDDDDEEDMDEDDDLVEEEDGSDEYRFFCKLLMEDGVLKEYYLKNYHNGMFFCLVCGAIGQKNARKKYKDCVALIQHSNSVAKTIKKRAHRGYGQAICKVLGWEIDKLPRIISELSEKRKESSNKSFVVEGEAQGNNDGDIKDDSSILESNEASIGINPGVDLQEKASGDPSNLQDNIEATQEDLGKESVNTGNMPSTGESVISEHQVLAAVEISKPVEDFSSTLLTVDDRESEKADDKLPLEEPSTFESERKDAAPGDPDQPAETDAPS